MKELELAIKLKHFPIGDASHLPTFSMRISVLTTRLSNIMEKPASEAELIVEDRALELLTEYYLKNPDQI